MQWNGFYGIKGSSLLSTTLMIDFLPVGQPALMECDAALATLLKVFEQLGLPVAMDKSEGPTQYLTFLGYQVNSQQMQVSPPQPKLVELLSLLRAWLGRSCRRSKLESLAGKLAHAWENAHEAHFQAAWANKEGVLACLLRPSFPIRSAVVADVYRGVEMGRKWGPAHMVRHIWSHWMQGCGTSDKMMVPIQMAAAGAGPSRGPGGEHNHQTTPPVHNSL